MKNQENNAAKRSYLIPLVIIVLAAAALCFSLTRQKASEGEGVAAVILHTNDVHAGYEDDIGYDGLALYKKELEKKYENVFLVDCGDAIQGAPIGAISKGIDVIRFMNYVGYDLATLGNHEFDFGVDALADALEHAVSQLPQASGRFPQVSGLSFTVDLSKGSTVKYDQEGQFVAVMGDYRVSDVLVGGEPLDLNAEYTMAVSAFIADGADGYGMLKETDLLSSTMLPDNEVVMKYIKENLGGVIPDDYRQTQGRITIKDTESSSGSTADTAQSAEPKTTGRDTPVATGSEQPADTEYIPGRYTAKDPAALGGNSASEFYVELNKDHTGVISLLDQIPIAWYSEEGVILNADTGEQLYEFRVEEDLLTLIDSAENGGASFEFERE